MAKFSVKDVKEMVNDRGGGARIGVYRGLRTKQQTDRDLYDMNYQVPIHGEFRKIKLPTARQMVDTFVSHLPLAKPVIEVTPFKDVNPYANRAIVLQDFFLAMLWWYMNQIENLVQLAAKDLGMYGEAYIKTVWDKDIVGGTTKEQREIAKLERMPLRMMCPNPTTCYPHPDHIDCHPVDMIQKYGLLASSVRRMFPRWKSNKPDNKPVVFTEAWSDESVCYLADGIECLEGGVVDNPYRRVPYTHVYSGYGHRDENNSPESKAVSLLRYAKDVVEQQCRYHSYLDKAAAFASMPMVELPGRREDYEEGGQAAPKSPKPGMITYRGEGEEGAKIVWAASNLPDGILQAIGVTEGLLGKIQPTVVRGEAPRGIESGYPMALLIGEARLQFGLPLQNLQTLFARALEQVRVLVRDVVKEEVPIWSENKVIKISPDECEGSYRVSVEFDATTPEARANRALMGQRLRQGGSISHHSELKDFHNNKNPQKEINRMLAERLLSHPAVERVIATEAVRKIYGEKVAVAVEQAMAEGEAGAVRKSRSTGVPQGGRPEAELPEDILAQAIGRRGQALRGEV